MPTKLIVFFCFFFFGVYLHRSDVKTSRDTSQTGRGRGARNNDRGGRGGAKRGGKSSNLVQTSGLFSQGSAEHAARSTSGYSRGIVAADRDTISQMKRPTYVKPEIKLDPDDEQKNIEKILGSDDEDYDDDVLHSDSFMPIKIRQSKPTTPALSRLLIFFFSIWKLKPKSKLNPMWRLR